MHDMRLSICCDALAKNPYSDLCSWCKEYAEFYEEAGPDETAMRLEVLDEDGSLIYKRIPVYKRKEIGMVSQKGRDAVNKKRIKDD